MDRDIDKIKASLIELADAIESGEREGMGRLIRNILGYDIVKKNPVRSQHQRCTCAKCTAVWEGDNNGDDGIN
jgi:hypothetical protein